nr:MAG TPA: hypothetical protein [Caudoviricetes sp.]
MNFYNNDMRYYVFVFLFLYLFSLTLLYNIILYL